MALHDDIQLFSMVPLFSGMNNDQLRLIAFGAERRHISPGQTLFREASPAECAYVIADGTVELSALGRDGKPHSEGTAGPGAMLSELALITLVERKFTAVAVSDIEVIRITRTLFHRLMEEYPAVATMLEERIRDHIAGMIGAVAPLGQRFA